MIKHSVTELIAIAYQYFAAEPLPEGMKYQQTTDYLRRQEAHDRASAEYGRWRELLIRLGVAFRKEQFPDVAVENRSSFLPSPGGTPWDRCFSAWLWLPPRHPDETHHRLGFLASVVVPYYVIYSVHRDSGTAGGESEISFELSPDEEPFARQIAMEIEATFPEQEVMPSEVGEVVVPGLTEHWWCPGEGRIFDCLFTETWR